MKKPIEEEFEDAIRYMVYVGEDSCTIEEISEDWKGRPPTEDEFRQMRGIASRISIMINDGLGEISKMDYEFWKQWR